MTTTGPGPTSYDSADSLAEAMIRASMAHGEHEKRIGHADEDWPHWYAAYMVAEQAGAELPQLAADPGQRPPSVDTCR